MMSVRDAFIFAVSPPPIPELGSAAGFSFRLQDRAGNGHDALLAARNQLLGLAAQSKISPACARTAWKTRRSCSSTSTATRPMRSGVPFEAINSALSTTLGSSYVNDFPNAGRLQRVVVQADAPARMQGDRTCCAINVLNNKGQAVPLSAFASTRWVVGRCRRSATTATRRCASRARRRRATAAARNGRDGALAAQLPNGFGFEWTGQSREERLAGAQAFILFGFALAGRVPGAGGPVRELVDSRCGAAGGAAGRAGRAARRQPARPGQRRVLQRRPDHHHRPGGKNAVLIIEFAKDLQSHGKSAVAGGAGSGPHAFSARS
jgi:multidrug efflux pump